MNKKLSALPKMPYGEGSFSIKGGKYYYRKRILLPNGEKTEIGVYANTAPECMKKMREEEKRLLSGVVDKEKTTLHDAMISWLYETKKIELREQSFNRLKVTIENQIGKSSLAKERYQSITTEELQKLINKLNNGEYSYSTIKKTYDALNEFYRYTSRLYSFNNPMLLVKKPKRDSIVKETKELSWFEPEDIDKFINAAIAFWGSNKPRYVGGYIYCSQYVFRA